MNRKQSEVEFRALTKARGWYTRKSRDRGYVNCPSCHQTITVCPKCGGSMLLNKAETLPDFVVSFDWMYVECKQGDSTWKTDDFTPTQEKVLSEHAKSGGSAYFFLLMGDGVVTRGGREAYLIEWNWWLREREKLTSKTISFRKTARSRSPEARELFATWALVWQGGTWKIPSEHPFSVWRELQCSNNYQNG